MGRAGRDLAIGGLLTALAIAVCVEAVRLRVGSALDPQPGFFPFVAGLLLVALSALLIVTALRPGKGGTTAVGRLGPPVTLVAGFVAYVWLLPWAGYPLATTLLMILTLRVQATRWRFAVPAALLLSLGSYALFVRLGVPLPRGAVFGG
jgi:hypothetical protein